MPSLLPSLRACSAASVTVALLGCAGLHGSNVIEEQIKVPVRVSDMRGGQVERDVVVTLFHDRTAPKPYPVLVFNHGRAVTAKERAAYGRVRITATSYWLAGFGFMVAVPTRIGYGVTGGEDVENSGPCSRKNYPPGYQAAAVQTLKVLEFLRERPDVARDRAVVMGQSYGGTTAITVASLHPVGVQGAINFAGGGGGNPDTRPGRPCSPGSLERLFAGYGKTARMPTLWIYTENDLFFGPNLPKEWFDAYRTAGGVGEYVRFPPNGSNGHLLFTHAPEVWRPRVLAFLQNLGYQRLREHPSRD
jgi:dienelactone hydrolase